MEILAPDKDLERFVLGKLTKNMIFYDNSRSEEKYENIYSHLLFIYGT